MHFVMLLSRLSVVLLFFPTAALTADPTQHAWQRTRDKMLRVMKSMDGQPEIVPVVAKLQAAKSQSGVEKALADIVLLDVSVNPESRVKIATRKSKIALKLDQPKRFLVRVDNMAGITAPLNFSTIDLATNPPGEASWCTAEVVDAAPTSKFFSGARIEYKLLRLTTHRRGLREVRLVGDAGQGTQDLGFRATTDILIDTLP